MKLLMQKCGALKLNCSFTVHLRQLVLMSSFLCASENQYRVCGQGQASWAHCALVVLYAGISVLYVGILLHCLKLELTEEFLTRKSTLLWVFLTNKINWLPPPPTPPLTTTAHHFSLSALVSYVFISCLS